MKISESMQIKGTVSQFWRQKEGGGSNPVLELHKAIRKTVSTLIWQFNKVIH